ncbi:Domain Homologous E6-AP Carboxyl Terminus with, partial [Rhizoctonia solani]
MAKGKSSNPADAFRKAQRAKELKKGGLETEIHELEDIGEEKLSSTQKDRLRELRTEVARIRKIKQDYVKAHPEQSHLVRGLEPRARRPEGTAATNAGGSQATPAVRTVFGKNGLPLHPERSIYYDPVLNPYGMPPPGMPYVEREALLPHEIEEDHGVQADPEREVSDEDSTMDSVHSDLDEEDSDDNDIVLPAGPPPSDLKHQSSDSDSDSEDSDNDIPMPPGPPPPKAPPPLPTGLPPTGPSFPPNAQYGIPFPPFPPNAAPYAQVHQHAPPPPPGFSTTLYSTYTTPLVQPVPYPQQMVGRELKARDRQFAEAVRAVQDPLSNIPHVTYQAHQAQRHQPPLSSSTGGQHTALQHGLPPKPSNVPQTIASATVSAEPELRDLKKEATAFVPTSMRRATKKGLNNSAASGLQINAAPDEGGDQSGLPAEPRKDLMSVLGSQLGAKDKRTSGSNTTGQGKDDYEKFLAEVDPQFTSNPLPHPKVAADSMSPTALPTESDGISNISSQATKQGVPASVSNLTGKSSILHRTPWHPPVAVTAQGPYITLKDGRQVIDGVGGAAVSCIGNGHPAVVKAVQEQVEKMAYVYNAQLSNEPAEELAKTLVEGSNGAFEQVGFVSGGSEAVEAMIKLARQYWFEKKEPKRTNFIARQLSFHGNTVSTLALGGHPSRRVPYEDVLDHQNFHHVSPAYYRHYAREGESEEDYVQRLKEELDAKFQELGGDTVVGFVAETVVGATTGCVPAPKGYFRACREVCDKYGALFMLDEVMSGMGRMGTLHAWESFGDGMAPDLQSVAKGLGGGFASIGAVLVSPRVVRGISDGSGYWLHGHTYQAHPIASAASLAVQRVIASENLLALCRQRGAELEKLLKERLRGPEARAAPYISDIRGGGLFWGVEFDIPDAELPRINTRYQLSTGSGQNLPNNRRFGTLLQDMTMDKGLIAIAMTGSVDGKRGDHLILAPPYNVTQEELELIVDRAVESVERLLFD